MRFLVEIGRFFLTALAVGITLPTLWLMLSLFGGSSMEIEAFLGVGAISFVMALLGGLVIGLPALWFARRHRLHSSLGKLATFGIATGALGGMLLSVVFWQGNIEIIVPSLLPWAVMGAVAGLVSAAVWFWLHVEDWDLAGIA